MRVVLGVTGGIAAYKSAELTRRLKDRGADVQVVMTAGAQQFVSPAHVPGAFGSTRAHGPVGRRG